jgi:glycosyltransferase involved in cell wall biosynthesis
LRFSVLITAYNREKFIHDSIISVLGQSFKDYELIIVDDCSNDNTFNIIRDYKSIDSRIRIFKNSKNVGQFSNRNIAASYAIGELLVFLDSDDYFKDNALKIIDEAFKEYPSAKHSAIYYNDDFSNNTYMNSREAIHKHFFINNILSGGPGSRVFNKKFYESIGGYPIKYDVVSDVYMNLYCTSIEPILLIKFNYLFYRRHDGQEINNIFSYLYNGYNYFNDILSFEFIPLTKEERTFLFLKNKRRFLINVFNYFIKVKNVKHVILAFRYTKFKFGDLFKAIFH